MADKTKSWADESDEAVEEQQPAAPTKSNPWNKNPITSVTENRPLYNSREFPVVGKEPMDDKNYQEKTEDRRSTHDEIQYDERRPDRKSSEGRGFGNDHRNDSGYRNDNDRRGSFNDRRGNYEDRRGNYQDRRGSYDDRRESHEDRRGSFNDRRGNYEDRRGSYEDRRESHEDRRGSYEDRRGNYEDRRGNYDDRRGSYEDRRGNYGDRRRSYQKDKPRQPIPIPTEPPFIAFVGNLPFEINEDEVQKFFESDNIKPTGLRLLFSKETNKPKGFGYVEFEDVDSLKRAVNKNGQELFGRALRIDIADSKPDDKISSKGGKPKEESESEKLQRPKLSLKPRSTPLESSVPAPSDVYKQAKVNPFGAATPRDENFYLKKKEEERLQREKEAKTETNNENGDMEASQPTQSPQVIQPTQPSPPKLQEQKKEERPRTSFGRGSRKSEDRSPNQKSFGRGSFKQAPPGIEKKQEKLPKKDKVPPKPKEPRPQTRKEEKIPEARSANPFEALANDDE